MTEEQAAKAVAAGMFPSADWQNENLAFIECPGISEHTTSNGRRDCRVTINDGMVPTVFCCHASCSGTLERVNREFRSAIGRLKTIGTGNHLRKGASPAKAPNAPSPNSRKSEPARKRALDPVALPDPIEDGEAVHVATCFREQELVGVVFGHGAEGRPVNRGFLFPPSAIERDQGNGTFIRVNPMKLGGFGDADVAAFRHCLLECDKASLEAQWGAILASRLPVSVAVHSGGRSIHAWVRVDAATADEFRERAKIAADALDEWEGIQVDRAVLNPSRLSRLAGRPRGGAVQHLLGVNLGLECWDDWVAWRSAAAVSVPEPEPDGVQGQDREAVRFFYRKHKKDFIMVRSGGADVVPLDKEGFKLALEFEGQVAGGDVGGIKEAIYRTMTDAGVDYDGSLPGYCRGLHEQAGRRYFVDAQARPLEGVALGDTDGELGHGWPTIADFLRGLLCQEEGARGLAPLLNFAWSLKLSRESLLQALAPPGEARSVRPGPASVFCGPKNCGKSFLVNAIVAPLLGGRVADAHKAFTSGSEGFNGELLSAEIWTVDDKVHACDIKSRRQFAASIKSLLYSGQVGFHAKFKEQITVTPWARLFIMCNDQEEAIRVLPVLTDDLADKMHFWRCYERAQGLPTLTAGDWAGFGARVRAELPAFAGWVDGLTIPEARQHSRNGMKCWQDPYIVGLLADQTPEHQLGVLLVHLFESDQLRPLYDKTAQEILEALNAIDAIRWQVKNLLHDDPALLGRYLGRLIGDARKLEGIGLDLTRAGMRRNGWAYSARTPHA